MTKQSVGTAQTNSTSAVPSYTIITDENMAHFKRSVDVRLPKKVTKADLFLIALDIKKLDPQQYDRIFINYYLLGRSMEGGIWASSNFGPDLAIIIYGITIEDEAFLRSDPGNPTWEIIGVWLDEGPGMPSKITVYREDNSLYMERDFPSAGAYSYELTETSSPRGMILERVVGNDFGEFYLINQQGNLQFWGQNGLFATGWKID